MTAPVGPTGPNLDQIRQMARQRGYSEQEIERKLYDAGLIQAPQAPPGMGGGFGQMAGSFGRGVLQGIGSMGDLMQPSRQIHAAAGRPLPPSGQAIANGIGLPQPQTGADSVAMRAGEGLGSSVALPGAGAGLAALGTASGAAGGLAEQAGAPVLGQMAASAAVGMGLPVFGMALAGSIRAALAGAGARRAAAREADALMQAGVGKPDAARTLGQVTEGGAARSVEGWLRNNPGSSPAMQRTLETQAKEMGDRVEEIAGKMGAPATKQVVGAEVQRSIKEGYIPISRTKQEGLYNKIYSLVPETSPVQPQSVYKLLEAKNDLVQMAGGLSDDIADPWTAGILQRIATTAAEKGGAIPFKVMKELRSQIGDALDGTRIQPDLNLKDAKLLYGALTEDMESAIAKTGGPAATKAWQEAVDFTRKRHELIEKFLEPLVLKRTPEQAFTALMSGTKDGATALQATLESLEPAAQGLVKSNVLRMLGEMPDESFSPELFFRRFHDLAPEAKTALFTSDPETGANLGALAKMIAERKAAGRVTFNPSGTARATSAEAVANAVARLSVSGVGAFAGSQVLGGPGAALGAIAAPVLTMAGAKVMAEKVFTNPRMISWMVAQTKKPYGAMAQELAILQKDAQRWDPASQEIANQLIGALSHMDWRSVILGQATADATATKP